jgi:hypothetical protein
VAIAAKVEIAFVANPYGTSLSWTDVTSRVVSLKTTSGRNYELGKNESSTVNLVLRNQDGAFNPLNTSSPYAPNVLPFRPVRITAAATGGGPSYPVWYGYVRTWPQSVKDATSQYEIVNLSGVDAFKAVLGFVPGNPYDVKVLKDYNIYTGGATGTSAWQFWAFDETASPFASENAFSRQTTGSVGTVTKTSPSPCRTAINFDGTQGLSFNQFIAYPQGELWFNTSTMPTAEGDYSTLYADPGSATPPKVAEIGDLRGFNPGATHTLGFFKSFANRMASDDAATFNTGTGGWTITGATLSRSTAVSVDGSSLQITPTTGGATFTAHAPLIPVTVGWSYEITSQVRITSATPTSAWQNSGALSVYGEWINGAGGVISTFSAGYSGTTSFVTEQSAAITAPAGAVNLRVSAQPFNNGSFYAGDLAYIDVVQVFTDSGRGSVYVPTADTVFRLPSVGSVVSLIAQLPFSSTGSSGVHIAQVPVPALGQWHHLAWVPRAIAGSGLFVVDGVAQPLTAYPNVIPIPTSSVQSIGAATTYAPLAFPYRGALAAFYVAATDVNLINISQVYAAQHYNYGTTSTGGARTHDFPPESTSQRVNDVLTAIAFPPAMMAHETGLTTMSASGNVSGTTATALLEAAADAELGDVFVDASGVVTFHNGNHRNSPTSVATFGGVGNIPYETSRVVDFDDTYIYNDVQVTQAGASPAYVYEIQDVTSQNTYGVRSLTVSAQVVNQSDVQAMGATLLARYKQPVARLSTLSFELRSKPTYLAQIMALKIGDLITVNYAALGGTVYALYVFIDGISHTVDENQWLVSFNTTPLYGTVAPPAPGSYPAVYTATY